MSEDKEKVVVPEEEKQQEEDLLKEPQVDEVRNSIIEKFELDEEDNKDLIDKLVISEGEAHKNLSTAIKQKRNWREKATAKIEPKVPEGTPQPSQPKSEDSVNVDQKIKDILEERDLDSLNSISDADKKELKAYAKSANISIKEATKTDFFKFKEEKFIATKKAEEGSVDSAGGSPKVQNFDINNPPKVDMSTQEGQETWDKYCEWKKTQ